jgi:hypothetical protein
MHVVLCLPIRCQVRRSECTHLMDGFLGQPLQWGIPVFCPAHGTRDIAC